MQQLLGTGFQIAQQAQRLKNFRAKVLGLFNNNQCFFALGMGGKQVLVEGIYTFFGKG